MDKLTDRIIKKKPYKEEDVIEILSRTIDLFQRSENRISFTSIHLALGLSLRQIYYWAKKSDVVDELFGVLKEIRDERYNDLLLSNNKSDPAMVLFYGKTALKRVEEQHLLKAANEKEIAKDTNVIRIGFGD
jgi:hypothetical protein